MRISYCLVQIITIVGLIQQISANHQHQVTYSESDDGETSYGYKTSPSSSINYEDDGDSYGAEESSPGHQLITGSGRMAVLGKRVFHDSSPSELHQQQQVITPSNGNQDQESQFVDPSNDQHSIPPVLNNLRVEWTESIDHGPSKSSSSQLSSVSPSHYAQSVPRYPINYSSNDANSEYPTSAGYSSPSPDDNNKFNGANGPHVGYATAGSGSRGHQGHYNEPYVGYSESRRMDSEWEFPEWLKELKKDEKDEKKVSKKEEKKETVKKPKYEADPWYEEPDKKTEEGQYGKKEEDKKVIEREKKEDDKPSEYEWSDPWNEKPKKEKKKPEKKEEKDEYGNKIKKEDDKGGDNDDGKVKKYEHHTHHHHDHWADHWYDEPKKEKSPEKKEESYGNEDKKAMKENEYKEDSYKDNKESLPVYSEDNYKKESDHWYDPKEEEKYREPEKKEEDKAEYYSENDYSKYDDNKYHDDKPSHDKLEKPEQIGRRPGDNSKDGHKSGGLLESYFWKALPGSVIDGKKHDSTYNYVIHVSKIDLDKAAGKKKKEDKVMKDDY